MDGLGSFIIFNTFGICFQLYEHPGKFKAYLGERFDTLGETRSGEGATPKEAIIDLLSKVDDSVFNREARGIEAAKREVPG